MSAVLQFRLAKQLTQERIWISGYQVIKVCMLLLLEPTEFFPASRRLCMVEVSEKHFVETYRISRCVVLAYYASTTQPLALYDKKCFGFG